MFWHPNEITRKKNMVSIIKIARASVGLDKDNYSYSNGRQQTTTTIETDEEDNNYNETNQPPMFLGDKKRISKEKTDTSIVTLLVWHP